MPTAPPPSPRARGWALFLLPLLFAPARADGPVTVPAEVPGALVLCGGGGTPDSVRDRFLELAGGPKAKLVVVPTASIEADGPDVDGWLTPWKAKNPASVVLLHTRDRKRADDPAFVKPLTEATGVWVSGGDQTRLTAAYHGTAVERELRKVLERGGVVGGTSAGTAVMSARMIEGTTAAGRAQTGAGFGLLPGVVLDQHFFRRNRVDRLLGVLAKHPGWVGVGVDEKTAAVVRGRRLRVVGDSYVAVCLAASATRPASVQVLKPGDEADLFALWRAARDRAKPPFAEQPADPVVAGGTLFIGGGGGTPPEIPKRFIEAAGGPDAPLVVVPTALGDAAPTDPEKVGEVRMLRRAGATNVRLFHTTKRSEADSPEFTKTLRAAKGVWFSGGRQWRFVDAYEGTLAERLFHDVLTRGGAIGGSSAGASIQSEYMPRGHPLGNLMMMAEGYERGFAFLPGAAVDQHFFARKRPADMTELMAAYPQFLGIGIDEGTYLVVRGSVAEVVGKGRVAVYDRRKPANGPTDYEELPPGTRYDLKARRVIEKE